MEVYPKFNQYVHYVLLNGEFIILDEQEDRYVILEAPTSLELEMALMEGNEQSALVQELLNAGILELSSQRQSIRRVTVQEHGIGDYEWRFARQFHQTASVKWMSFRALQTLLWIKTLLSTRGFHSAMNSLRALKATQAHSIHLPIESSEHNRICACAATAIAEAALWMPYRVECLEYSMSLSRLLLSLGVCPTFRIGVQRYDFLSHAWVEVGGKVLGDDPNLPDRMCSIVEI
ncbi:MAG: lasso peptide biosynthesis B2 protein [Halomonas sp.]|nr:lasso peptide biosynthesis B2 protein [Halomonas sp.]MBR2515495.1 lasso peptide biosynthesis B2 protein [Halomonas sp.]